MKKDKQIDTAIKQVREVHRQRREILSLSPEKALAAILDSPSPAALVHSFPEQDLYFLIHEIGIKDSISILSLASDKQWEYILDLETWEGDRINTEMVTRWLDLLFKVDPNRFVRWFLEQKKDLVEFHLFKNLEIRVREHDQDPSIFGEGFFTFDDIFYIRVVDYPLDEKSGAGSKKLNESFLPKFLKHLADHDHFTYQRVLMETPTFIPAEYEEETYRMRNVRLAEKGFLPFEEAVGVYQPLTPRELSDQHTRYMPENTDRSSFPPAPLYPLATLGEDNLFTRALKRIESEDLLQQIQTEFAALANQIAVADQKRVRSIGELRSVVKKACGYISMGLERLIGEDTKPDAAQTAALIQQLMLSQIFRVGFGSALELKWRAEKWRKESWFDNQRLPLNFWGEKWLGVLGGLLIKKPMFYDSHQTGELYREFVSMDDIRTTEIVLNEMIEFDRFFSHMRLNVEPLPDSLLTHKNLILTLWARNYLGLPEEVLPLPVSEFKHFFNDLWSGRDKPRKTRQSMKAAFLKWLSDRSGLDGYEISQRLGQTLENLFNEIETEYGEVSGNDLDPRYVHLFLLKE
ncbi:DUF6178 family protein [Thermodesulfobacteriota bacterium]